MGDLLLGPLVGGLSSSGANLWGRASGPGVLHAWLGQEPNLNDARLAATSLPLTPQDGFSGVAPLKELAPDTRYYYALTLDNSSPNPSLGPYAQFTTFPPSENPLPFNFALGSCFRPETADSGGIFRAIEKQRLKDNLRFILLIGDQIYADAYQYNGLGKIACTLDEYRKVYEYTWSRPPFRELLYNLPAFMTLDDHEVDDDWTWTDSSRTRAQIPIWDRVERYLKGLPREERQLSTERVRAALQAYWEHQGMHSPHFIQPLRLNAIGQYGLTPNDAGSLAYSFTFGSAAFFVLDTRTMRVKGRRGKTMLGEGQWLALESWLLAVKDRFPVKFLVSSCALIFQLWLDIARDRWTGFPEERSRLLNFIASHGIEGTYVLTGDLHCAHAISADLEGPQGLAVPLWEFCATPFEQVPQVLSHRTYYPLRGSPVLSEKLHFIVAQYNYGVVRVSFDANGKPAVHYEVYGENGDLLAEVG